MTSLCLLGSNLVAASPSEGNLSVILCRGAGSWGAHMRLRRRGEILRITLRCKPTLDRKSRT